MRESIRVDLSKRFSDKILKPEVDQDFEFALDDMIKLNTAYALMLADRDIIDRDSAAIIIDGLKHVQKNMTRDDVKGELEDLYFNVERLMFNKVGSKIGGRLHAGRSRNDVHSVVNRMEIRKSVWDILDLIIELQQLLLEKATENTETIITGYTHFQPGQPITLGHYYTAFNNALCRDFGRILNAYGTANVSPYGAAAFAGSSFPIDRQGLSDLLGFDSVMENTLDSVCSRDYYVELLSAFSLMATNVSRVAEDMYFWATFENGILDVGGEVAICSSIMPQKRNPVSLEMARAKASHIIAGLTGTMIVLKGAPFSNTMDLFEIPTLYWNAADQVKQMLICMIETITYSKIRKERARQQASDNLSTVTSLADYMVKKSGISFTDAHDIVGNIVALVIANGSLISGFTPELVKAESKKVLSTEIILTKEEINSVLDPFNNVQTKTDIGGPSILSVDRMIKNGKQNILVESQKLAQLKEQVGKAYEVLEEKAAQLIRKDL